MTTSIGSFCYDFNDEQPFRAPQAPEPPAEAVLVEQLGAFDQSPYSGKINIVFDIVKEHGPISSWEVTVRASRDHGVGRSTARRCLSALTKGRHIKRTRVGEDAGNPVYVYDALP